MSNLLFIFDRDISTVSIMRDCFTNLKHSDDIKSDFIHLLDVAPSDINSHDVIIFIRPNDIYTWKIAECARKAGHVTVTFCDDDLLNLPKTIPTIPWRKRGLIRTISHSNVIWSFNRYITEKYRHFTIDDRIALFDIVFQPKELSGIDVIHDKNRTIKIVYAAASSHAALFEKYVKPIVPNLVNEFGNTISFTFVGVHPEMGDIHCEYVSGMPLMEYRKFMKESHFDIGLAPLHMDEFSKCKYFNKFIEYTMQGIVGVYSNVEPYTYVVEDGQNGLLADNIPDAWLNALRKAIMDEKLRVACVENAIGYLKDNHSEQACIYQLKEAIPEISGAGKRYNVCKGFGLQKVLYIFSRPLDWLYLTYFYLKNRGIKYFIEKTKLHFISSKVYKRARSSTH